MIVVDIGNTNTVIGVYLNKKLKITKRINTKDKKFEKNFIFFFKKNKKLFLKINHFTVIISSVVPYLNKNIQDILKSFDFKYLNINMRNIPNEIKFNYDNKQLGADRIANTFAVIDDYGKDTIVIDFGTATTFDITKNKIYKGGVISPGIKISHEALIKNASKLNKTSIKKIPSIIGKNTKESIQSGFYWGYVNLINGILNKIIIDQKFQPKIIITGGLANTFKRDIIFKTYYEPNLTLKGLYLIGIKTYE